MSSTTISISSSVEESVDSMHTVSSSSVTTDVTYSVPISGAILNMPVPPSCRMAPLQPQAPLQPSEKEMDPLIGGEGGGNLSFELTQQHEGI